MLGKTRVYDLDEGEFVYNLIIIGEQAFRDDAVLYNWLPIKGKLEHWTGYIDRNKNEIYEGDLADGYEVVFSKKASRFCIRKDYKNYIGTYKKAYSLIGTVKTGDIYEKSK